MSTTSLDYHGYPHIFESIITHAPFDALLALRSTSRSVRDAVDVRLTRHISISLLGNPQSPEGKRTSPTLIYALLPNRDGLLFSRHRLPALMAWHKPFSAYHKRIFSPADAAAWPARWAVALEHSTVLDLSSPPYVDDQDFTFAPPGAMSALDSVRTLRLPRDKRNKAVIERWGANGLPGDTVVSFLPPLASVGFVDAMIANVPSTEAMRRCVVHIAVGACAVLGSLPWCQSESEDYVIVLHHWPGTGVPLVGDEPQSTQDSPGKILFDACVRNIWSLCPPGSGPRLTLVGEEKLGPKWTGAMEEGMSRRDAVVAAIKRSGPEDPAWRDELTAELVDTLTMVSAEQYRASVPEDQYMLEMVECAPDTMPSF